MKREEGAIRYVVLGGNSSSWIAEGIGGGAGAQQTQQVTEQFRCSTGSNSGQKGENVGNGKQTVNIKGLWPSFFKLKFLQEDTEVTAE